MRNQLRPPGERALLALLVLVTLVLRLPFVSRFDFVSFDGTYYIAQARALLHGSLAGGAFPIGYPLLIAPVLAVARDGVLAAALVSLLAAVGSVLVMYALARRHVATPFALGAALILAATPIFIDASLATLSESAYLFWVLLSLWYFGGRRATRSGLSIGMAAATRPEALAIAGVLGLFTVRAPRHLARFALAFVLVYGISVAAMSASHGRLTLLSRAGAYQSVSTAWSLRERTVEYAGKEEVERRIQAREGTFQRGRAYAKRLPRELGRLGRHALPALPGLVLLVYARRRAQRRPASEAALPWFVLAAFAPLPLIPLFTDDRGIVRWLVPYVAPMILFAVIGLSRVRPGRVRAAAAALTGACVVVSLVVNERAVGRDIESDMRSTRDIARRFAERIEPGDMIADRKPYFSFYAGARYLEIPVGPYDETLAFLGAQKARFLLLHAKSAHFLRPSMRPLVFDRTVIRGELRYRQIQFEKSGEIVYERIADTTPLEMRNLTTPEVADHSPVWSPDGGTIMFRRHRSDGTGLISLIDPSSGEVRDIVQADPTLDVATWSGDGAQIVFTSTVDGRMVLNMCEVATGRIARISAGEFQQWNPSWCARAGDMLLCSDLRGSPAVYRTSVGGRTSTKVSFDEPADLASISPSGKWISWVDPAGLLVLVEVATGGARKVRDPKEILSVASWSPDESQVLVEAFDWGAPNVYMIDVGTGRSLRVTCSHTGIGMPSWSPAGNEMVVVSALDGKPALWLESNLEPYVERLDASEDVHAFDRPASTRTPPPAGARRFRDSSP